MTGGAAVHSRASRLPARFWRAACLVFVLDWATKFAAARLLVPHVPTRVVGSVLRLTLSLDLRHTFWLGIPHTPYVAVPGGAPVFYAVKLLILCAMVWFALRTPPRLAAPIGVLFGAGLANTLEQIATGAVINFLDIGQGAHRWPTFNLADAALVITALALAVTVHRETVRERGWRGALLTLDGRLPRSLRRPPDDRG